MIGPLERAFGFLDLDLERPLGLGIVHGADVRVGSGLLKKIEDSSISTCHSIGNQL